LKGNGGLPADLARGVDAAFVDQEIQPYFYQ
jgi:hypothetical protein